MAKPLGKKILVIPDSHARPGVSNRRFDALGAFIYAKRPDIIVNIGDWADMASLSSYDKGKISAEGKRYSKDIAAANDALDLVHGHMEGLDYCPELHFCVGNHEERILRACSINPELEGKLSLDDLKFAEYGWKVHDFLQPAVIEGILFQHYLPSGPMGKPTSGVNHARSLVLKAMMSTVVGHSHQRDFYEMTRADKRKMFGLVVGCYDEGGHGYAAATQHNWWSGLVMLHESKQGTAEPAFYSLDYVLRKYG